MSGEALTTHSSLTMDLVVCTLERGARAPRELLPIVSRQLQCWLRGHATNIICSFGAPRLGDRSSGCQSVARRTGRFPQVADSRSRV